MKIVIVLKEDMGIGFASNAAACIASGLFHLEKELLGEQIDGNDLKFYPYNKDTPIGIGVLGEDSLVNKFSGDLPLLK
ncbi:DUF2000 family protein [Candidatus Woesearchaeota archaeon]|nr:DUF2000 family protein [Candidatus Woesearchaeota archaeon]